MAPPSSDGVPDWPGPGPCFLLPLVLLLPQKQRSQSERSEFEDEESLKREFHLFFFEARGAL